MKRQTVVLAVAAVAAAGSALADGARLSSKSRQRLFDSQTDVLDERAAGQYANSVRLKPPSVATPSRAGSARWHGSYRGAYLRVARSAARRHRVPVGLFLRLVERESGWDARARSHKGAIGLAQLMPGTARRLGVDPRDPAENLDGGARYLRIQYDRFRSWRLALAAYNAGPDAVRRHGGVPPFRETLAYVHAISGG